MGGKNRHSKDRMFITSTEWKTEYGGKKVKEAQEKAPIEFDKCALTMTAYGTVTLSPLTLTHSSTNAPVLFLLFYTRLFMWSTQLIPLLILVKTKNLFHLTKISLF